MLEEKTSDLAALRWPVSPSCNPRLTLQAHQREAGASFKVLTGSVYNILHW